MEIIERGGLEASPSLISEDSEDLFSRFLQVWDFLNHLGQLNYDIIIIILYDYVPPPQLHTFPVPLV